MGNITNFLTSFVAKPRKEDDDSSVALRGDGYGNQYIKTLVGNKQALAEEASYFTATVPIATIDTGIAAAAVITAFTDTNSLALIQNTSSPGAGAVWIYPDFLRMYVEQGGTVTTTATCIRMVTRIWPSGINPYVVGTPGTILTPRAVNTSPGGAAGAVSAAKVIYLANGNAFTTLASTGQGVRVIDNIQIPTGIMVLNDCYQLSFGCLDPMTQKHGQTAVRATDTAFLTIPTAPCAIGPGETLQIMMWHPSGAGGPTAFEPTFGYWEH